MSKKSSHAALRARLTSACAIAGLFALCAPAAHAQEAAQAPVNTQGTENQAQPDDEAIVVTGTRVPRPDYAYSNPVVSIDSAALQYSGSVNLTDFLQELPALTNSFDANDAAGANTFIGGTGINLLNLRNLGIDRTLVLVNGRRHVASLPGSAAIDTATIPIDLIKRIEVSTGGASAIYGADGVTGVVNFVLNDDFDGFRVRGQTNWTEEGGAEESFVSGVWGVTTDGGRANLTIAAEYTKESALTVRDRKFTHQQNWTDFFQNPDDPSDDPSLPDSIPVNDIHLNIISAIGVVDTGFDGAFDFQGDGSAIIPGIELGAGSGFEQGGSGLPVTDLFTDILPDVERYSFNAFFHYDLTPHARLFTELKYVNTQSFSLGQATFDQFAFIQLDNPFIPANILDDANANGAPLLLFSRYNSDLGQRGEDITRQTLRGVIGLRGDLSENVQYEISAVYGQTDTDSTNIGNRFQDRFAAALDVVDADPGPGVTPVCRSDLDPNAPSNDPNTFFREVIFGTPDANYPLPGSFTPGPGSGCTPLNIFGPNVSQAAIDWINVTTTTFSSITQADVQAYVHGTLDSWFTLPGGSVGFAAGVEWRQETSEARFDAFDRAGLTFFNAIQDSFGEYDVGEAFGEITLPILKDRPFFDSLAIDGAIRISDYSTVGQTTTWKAGLVWAPIEDVTFRGTVAEAVRAPNIGELFNPASQNFAFITDPCDADSLNNGTEFRTANCAAILTALGIDPTTFQDPNAATVAGTLAGNPDLNEETAETVTIGVIVRPRFIRGLILSADWYDIDLTNAINTLDPEAIAQQCVDLPTIDNQFCALLTRSTITGGIIDFFQQPVNVASFTTRGVDFAASYQFEPADWGWGNLGRFSLRLVGNYLDELSFINLPGAAPDPDKGEANAPEWQTSFDLTWEKGNLTVNYGFNYFSETQRFTLQERAGDPDIADPQFLDFDARATHDIQARYMFGDNFTLYGGVNNFTNQEPDIGQTFYPVSAVGRTFYVGLNAQLN